MIFRLIRSGKTNTFILNSVCKLFLYVWIFIVQSYGRVPNLIFQQKSLNLILLVSTLMHIKNALVFM
jgi:hypothetical protein